MNPLLAAPKLNARKQAKIVVGYSAFVLFVGIVLTAAGMLSVGELLVRSVLVAGFGAALLWVYAWLLRVAGRSPAERMPLVVASAGTFGLLGFFGGAAIMMRGLALGDAATGAWWMAPASFGVMLAAAGVVRRVGETMHCPQCEYEFKFAAPEDAPIKCPECGTPWLGRLKKGRRLKSGRLVAAGVAITVFSFLVPNPVFYMGTLAPHLPTWALFAGLYASPKSVYTAWDELALRPLDAASTRMMAQRVIAYRSREQYDSASSGWFEKMMAAKKVPADLVERYYAEALRAELVVPRRVRAGQEFEVSLRVGHVANGWVEKVGLMFGGYRVGDGPVIGRQEATLWEYQMRPQVFSRRKDVVVEKLKVDVPGEVRVKATWWIAVEPSFTDELKWTVTGEPRTPAKALWFRKFDEERVVRVER